MFTLNMMSFKHPQTRLYAKNSNALTYSLNDSVNSTSKKRKRSKTNSNLQPTILNPFTQSKSNDDDDSDDENDKSPFKFPKMFNHNDTDVYTEKNHIFFKTDVNEDSIDKLSREIDMLNLKLQNMSNKTTYGQFTPKPILLHITTKGGDLLAGFFAFDKIRNSKIPIHTIIEGGVASAGSIMSIAGQHKYITKNSHVLIHQLRTWSAGTYEDLLDESKNCAMFMSKLVNLYYENCNNKMTKSKIRDILKRDIFWSSKDAISHGIVDEIWDGTQE